MKTIQVAILLLTLTTVPAPAAEAPVRVQFQEPERYTDVSLNGSTTDLRHVEISTHGA